MSAYNDRKGCVDRSANLRGSTVNQEGVARFLRSLYPSNTAANVSADTKINARTVERWLSGAGGIRDAHYTALWLTYGPEFLVASLHGKPPRWLDRAAKDARLEALDRELDQLQRKRAEAVRLKEEACGEQF